MSIRVIRRGAALRDYVPLPQPGSPTRWYVPRHLEVEVRDEGDCDLRLDLEVRDDGVVECQRIDVRRRPGGRVITTSLLRSLPLEQIGRRAVSAVAMQITASTPDDGVKVVPVASKTQRAVAGASKAPVGRPRVRTPEVQAEALKIYKRHQALLAAGEKQPVRVIRQELGPGAYSRPYIYKLLKLGAAMHAQGEKS